MSYFSLKDTGIGALGWTTGVSTPISLLRPDSVAGTYLWTPHANAGVGPLWPVRTPAPTNPAPPPPPPPPPPPQPPPTYSPPPTYAPPTYAPPSSSTTTITSTTTIPAKPLPVSPTVYPSVPPPAQASPTSKSEEEMVPILIDEAPKQTFPWWIAALAAAGYFIIHK